MTDYGVDNTLSSFVKELGFCLILAFTHSRLWTPLIVYDWALLLLLRILLLLLLMTYSWWLWYYHHLQMTVSTEPLTIPLIVRRTLVEGAINRKAIITRSTLLIHYKTVGPTCPVVGSLFIWGWWGGSSHDSFFQHAPMICQHYYTSPNVLTLQSDKIVILI